MRRIFAIFAVLCFGIAATFAQVTVSPSPLYKGYTGKVTITFDPSAGNAGMASATACYAHTGLITSASTDDSDWKYVPGSGWRASDEPELTQDGSVWKLEINNIYEFYKNAPLNTNILKLAFVFHDGPSGSLEGKTAEDGDILIVLEEQPTPTCTYELEMYDSYGDGWNGNHLVVTDNDLVQTFTITDGSFASAEIKSFGGTPVLSWINGSYSSETSFAIYAINGLKLFAGKYSDLPYTITDDPCSTAPNPYEITGLKAESTDKTHYTISWDKNDNVDKYVVSVYDPVGTLLVSETKTNSDALTLDVDLSEAFVKADGDFTVKVTPYDASDNLLAKPTELSFEGIVPKVTEMTIRALIPSDQTDYNISQGVYVRWKRCNDGSNVYHYTLMEQEPGTRWWKTTLAPNDFYIRYSIQTPSIDGIVHYCTWRSAKTDQCVEILGLDTKSSVDWYYISNAEVDCHAPDHDFRPVSITPTGDVESYKLAFEFGPDTAAYYTVNLYDENDNKLTYYSIYKSDITTDVPYELAATYHTAKTIHVAKVTVQAYDEGWDATGSLFVSTTPFDILPNPLSATNIAAVHNPDGTYTISWDAVTGVDKFVAYFWDDNNNYISGEEIITASTPPVGGRYSLTTSSPISPEGRGGIEVDSYVWNEGTSDYDWQVDAYYDFLTKVNLNVLVPDDNNMDITGGVFVGYWTPLYDIANHCIALTDNGGGWWSADIYVDAPSYSFLVANSNINSTWDQWSENIENISSTTYCTELLFKTASKDKWPLSTGSDCYADNHDYRITGVSIDASNPGRQYVEISAVDYAYYAYTIEIASLGLKENGVSSSSSKTLYYSSPADVHVDYSFTPVNSEGDTIAATVTGSFTLPANDYMPQNLKAEVQSDGSTVNFSWDAPATAPDYFRILAKNVSEVYTNWVYNESNITGITASASIPYNGECEWALYAYKDGSWVAYVDGPHFTTNGAVDCSPKNIQVSVSGMTATITWDMADPANYGYIQIDDEYDSYVTDADVEPVDGHYTYSFTVNYARRFYARIASYNYNGSYWQLLSPEVKTDLFAIPSGKVEYALVLTAGTGGSVSSNPAGTTFEEGASVEITATPDAGYNFVQWSDGNTNATRTITMDGNKILEALFAVEGAKYTLAISAGANGSVNTDVNGEYDPGASVTIVATPDAGYLFDQWSDGDKNATRTISMTSDITLSAAFKLIPPKYTLTLAALEGGSVNESANGQYDEGTSVDIVATAETGYNFVQWSDGNINASRTIIMNADKSLIAMFEPATVEFTVTVTAGEGGSVNDVSGTYTAGTPINVVATPDAGYVFLYWSDGTTAADYTFYLYSDVTIEAIFTPTTTEFALNIAAGEHGSVNTSVNGVYPAGTTVTIEATPESGYKLLEWSDGNKGASRNITLTQDTALVAFFVDATQQYTLNISAGANGSVNSSVNGTYDAGEDLLIVATPDEGYAFDQWSDGDKNSTRWVRMNEDITLEASFKVAYNLIIAAGANGSVNTEVNGKYDANASVHIVATPASGYAFDQWSDGNTSAERDIVMTANTTLIASFKVAGVQYTLSISAGANGTVNDAVNGNYDAGASVTIIATPDAGYIFDQWSDGNTNATRTITMDADVTLTASFKEASSTQYTLTISAGAGGTVNETVNGSYPEGTNVTIIATPNSGYIFNQWSDGDKNATRVVTMNANITLEASFLSSTTYTVKITVDKGELDEIHGKVKVNDGEEKKKFEGVFNGGTKITVEAVPEEGYTVDEWSDDEDEKGLVREIEVTKNLDIKVSFRELKKVTLTVNIKPAKSGTVELNGEVRENNQLKVTEGKSITAKAIPAQGYKFKGWENSSGEIFDTDSEISIKMKSSREITAVFEEAQGFENIEVEGAPARKMIIDGQLFILRDGKLYNAAGVLVR